VDPVVSLFSIVGALRDLQGAGRHLSSVPGVARVARREAPCELPQRCRPWVPSGCDSSSRERRKLLRLPPAAPWGRA